jgi:membrane fusion protein (multidrug efflux system)
MKMPPPAERLAHKARRRLLIGGTLGLVVATAVAVALVSGPASGWATLGAQPEAKPVVPLEFIAAEVVRPAYASLPVVIEFSGPLVAQGTAIVRAKSAGTLLDLRVAEGSRVKAGQVLGEIDLADLQSRVLDRTALVDSAQASLAEAQRQHLANVGLASQNFISPTALQTSQARLDAARAQLKSAEAQLSTSRLGVKEAALVAPISGIVGKRHVVPGEKVSAEQQLLTVVAIWRRSSLPAASAPTRSRRCNRGSRSRCASKGSATRCPAASAIPFSASSIGRVNSVSVASGDAPG